jgi:hypothetical protein
MNSLEPSETGRCREGFSRAFGERLDLDFRLLTSRALRQ